MPDIVGEIFERVRPEPDAAFVAALHQRALAELTGGLVPMVVDDSPVEIAVAGQPRDRHHRHRHRRRTAAALLVVAAAASLLALLLREPTTHAPVVPATSVPAPTSPTVTASTVTPSTVTPSTVVATTVPGTPVPKVKGLLRDAAQATIEAAGFTYVGSGENLAPCPQAGVLTAWDSQPAEGVAVAPSGVVTVRYYCPLSRIVATNG
jgi:hypothetical protein